MFLYLNRYHHIISINERATYVKRNKNGIVIPCMRQDAYAVIDDIGDNIYYLAGKNDVENYTDISEIVGVERVPSNVVPRKYSFIDGDFVTNEVYEDSVENLTSSTTENTDGLMETYDLASNTSDGLSDCRSAIEELYEMIINEE